MARSSGKYTEVIPLSRWIAGAIVASAVLLKLGLIGREIFPFNADEAIVALMAKHTLLGDWPVFFYGQAYMGSLDATLVAMGFRLIGERILVIRLIQILLYAGTVLTTILLGWRIFKNRLAGLVAGLILAIPTTNLTLYTTISLGGYGEALLLGNLILLAGLCIQQEEARLPIYFVLGFLIGLGFWAFGLTLVYSLPVFLLMVKHIDRVFKLRCVPKIGCILTGILLGLTPVIYWAFSHSANALIPELAGGAVAGTSGVGYPSQVMQSFRNFVVFGLTVIFGFRPPWDVFPMFLPGLFFGLIFWLVFAIYRIRERTFSNSDSTGLWLLRGLAILTILGYLLTPFGGDPSGRYFLPLGVVLALLGGAFVAGPSWPRSSYLRWLLLCGLVLFQFGSNLEVLEQANPGFTTQFDASTRVDHAFDNELIEFLEARGATRGYSTYWISYPLDFQSQENLIFVPALPYHADLRFTERDNRYGPYNDMVSQAERIAFITTGQETLDLTLTSFLHGEQLQWREDWIGPYHVFYDIDNNLNLARLKEEWIQ